MIIIKIALYVRVSRKDLNLENQIQPLVKRAEVEGWEYKIVPEKESTRNTRPVKELLLKQLRNKEYDGVCVYALDRWCRSVSEFAFELEEFNHKNIRFISLREGFDFDSAIGKAMATMVMTFAQLERDLIRERTMQGLERAKAWGKIGGRHPDDCGCGIVNSNGKVHNGKIKPIKDDKNRLVGWKYANGMSKMLQKEVLS